MPLCVNGYLTRGHVAIITETESTYVTIESTLWFDDIKDVPGLFPLLRAVQRSRMRSRERSGRRPGNEANIEYQIRLVVCKTIFQHESIKHIWQTGHFLV